MSFLLKLVLPLFVGFSFLTGCQPQSQGVMSQGVMQNRRAAEAGVQISPTVVASSAALGSEVTLALSSEPKLKGSNIMVSVSNLDRTVSLAGMVTQKAQADLALQVAKKQAKGAKVVSQLEIMPMKAIKKAASGKQAAKKSAEACCD